MEQQSTFTKQIFIRPQDLTHAGLLCEGTMMAWADEVAFIAAAFTYPYCTFVIKVFYEFNFISGIKAGDIIQIEAEVLKKETYQSPLLSKPATPSQAARSPKQLR